MAVVDNNTLRISFVDEASFINDAVALEEKRIDELNRITELMGVKEEEDDDGEHEGEGENREGEDGAQQRGPDGNMLPAKRSSSDRWTSQKRRIARNYREQKRAHRITDVIDQLKSALMYSKFPIASQSKYHVLRAASSYVTYLERKERCFLMEKQLLEKLTKERLDTRSAMAAEDANLVDHFKGNGVGIVRVNFSSLFHSAPVAMCIASIDGRLIAVNRMFELTMGYTAEEARALTIFSLVPQEYLHGAFKACSAMLKKCNESSDEKPAAEDAKADGDAAISSVKVEEGIPDGAKAKEEQKKAKRRKGKPFVTYAKPKRGHPPYADCVSTQEECVYGGGKPSVGLTQALSVEGSLAASLGLHQLSLSISLSNTTSDDSQQLFHVTILEAQQKADAEGPIEVDSEESEDEE